jgi:preprotein translocase SecE subunit
VAKENVTRIKIPSDGSKKPESDKKKTVVKPVKATIVKKAENKQAPTEKEPKRRFMSGFIGYFVGAWRELRQVRWPNRRMTWSYTLAVIIFSVVMAIFIVLLDLGLNELSRKVLL